eukprot:TRINITY_DN1681_c0_g1_i1.p1 TRINITY_DN1681_c0_g1~~TRINITY_DN1681_c0_g1_i1.p1  ORF type:complete len:1130 (-),score=354.28 TRINITY_DN1681_c0_g1_i1:51-3440(-)
MFLEWIQKLGFIQPDADSRVFLDFPISSRMLLAAHTSAYYLKDTSDVNCLATPTQIHVALEAMGQGFGLPIDDFYDTIESVTELYRRWLLGEKRPKAMDLEEQIFYRKMFKHMTLLFEPRGLLVDLQAQLCSRVLTIIESMAKEKGSKFDTETWETLLRLMLGSTDCLLSDPTDSPYQLSTMLCPLLLKVLFELFFWSKTKNEFLWASFAKLAFNWRHRLPLIFQWSNVTAGCTGRVLRLLYGPTEGTNALTVVQYDGDVIVYDFDDELTYFLWHKTLYLLGDLNGIKVPINHWEAMKGVHNLVEQFLQIGSRGKLTEVIPDGNTIFEIFGVFLFDSINAHTNEEDSGAFDKGKAQAYVTSTKLLSTKCVTTKFDSKHLASYYNSVENIIRHDNYLMSVVVHHSTQFFNKELEGSRVLVPYYLEAIRCIMSVTKLDGISLRFSILRESTIKLLASIMAFPSHFYSFTLGENKDFSEISFSELHGVLNEIMTDGLQTEDDTGNRQLLLWAIQSYFIENLSEYPVVQPFSETIINIVLSKITENVWTVDDLLCSLNLLSQLSRLIKYQPQKNPARVVTVLSNFLETALQNGKVPEIIITRTFYSILDWIVSGTWILRQPAVLKQFLSVIELGMGKRTNLLVAKSDSKRALTTSPTGTTNGRSSPKSPLSPRVDKPKAGANYSPKVAETAQIIYMKLMNLMDNFPAKDLGPSNLSSLYTEKEIFDMHQLKPHHVTYYIFGDHSLLSVIRHNRINGTRHKVTLILRNMSGKYVWEGEMNFQKDSYVEPVASSYFGAFKPTRFNSPEEDDVLMDSLRGVLNPSENDQFQKVLASINDVVAQTAKVLASKKGVDTKARRPIPFNVDDTIDTTTIRILIQHLGLPKLNTIGDFYSVKSEPNFFESFSQLDATPERETFQIGIVYAGKDQLEESQILGNQSGSLEYRQFIQYIGWLVNMEDHFGFKGDLKEQNVKQTPYYATYDKEVIFAVSTLIPNGKDPNQKIKSLKQSQVLITWTDDIENFKQLPSLSVQYNIVIYPLESRLVGIKIISNDVSEHQGFDVHLSGPALDGMVVTPQRLPIIVRETAINAVQLIRGEEKTKPLIERKKIIDDLISKSKLVHSLHEFYGFQIAPVPV